MNIGDMKVLLEDQKSQIIGSLDSLSKTAGDIVLQRNKKIQILSAENETLRNRLANEPVAMRKNFLRIISTVEELHSLRDSNGLLKTLMRRELYIKNLKKNIKEIKKETEERGTLNSKDMAAFKILALELEEKEKTLKDNRVLIDNLENDKKNLTLEKKNTEALNSGMASDLELLRKKNRDLESASLTQLNTIETLSREIQSKNEKIIELKDQFIGLLDSYNDILQQIN
jgi:hypothetical protein